MNEIIRPWEASVQNSMPANIKDIKGIVEYGNNNLTVKQQKQIVGAYNMEAYDMAAEYAWKKAIIKLRNSLANLGIDFIAEFVQRDDVDEYTPIENVLTERATIDLAERLGVINSTGALHLRQAQELVNHYLSANSDNEMSAIDSLSVIRPCVEYILSEPNVKVALAFSEFRNRLLNEDLKPKDAAVAQVINSPLFYIRTVITILLSAIKKNKSIVQEHALVNITMLLPEVWGKLSSSDKWMIGETYRDVFASGDAAATKGLKLALGKVGGFDFVPETLRSTTFKEMARKLIDVHDSFNNFYNESGVVKALANLGTRIPEPAFLVCLDAYLLVYLGNYYGYSRNAAPIAEEELKKISKDRWQAYFSGYIHTDDRILNNLETPTQVSRMRNLLVSIDATSFSELPKDNQKLFDAIMKNDSEKVRLITNAMYKKLV
jgi:hypothetical protein